jgi:hypothetical protein
MIQNRLSKYFQIQTEKSKTEIFADLANKIEIQKRNNGITSADPVDYKSFKISNNAIEIERWPHMLKPFRGLGRIYFNFEETNDRTIIKCKCEPFIYAGLLIIIFAFILLTFLTTLILFNARDNYFKIGLFILLIWIIGLGSPLLGFLYHRNALKEYSKIILSDLDLRHSSS